MDRTYREVFKLDTRTHKMLAYNVILQINPVKLFRLNQPKLAKITA
ncbi:hypothetical protein [Halanaerobium congolense]|jgi:hypothetical protein|nr:hypothetical protein [Halanaerobium congolense]